MIGQRTPTRAEESRKSYRWVVHPARADESMALARSLGISTVTAQVMLNRDVTGADDGAAFLTPRMSALPDPGGIPDMDRAVARLRRALRDDERIIVHGDYDVDGLSGSALLQRLFRTLGRQVDVYIPNRLTDGYGLRCEKVAELAAAGYQLMITVDTGTAAVEQIALARELGMDVIVTDHHEPQEVLPHDAAILNPKRSESVYPCRALSGTGVAFQLAWALARDLCGGPKVTPELRHFLVDSLALVALATVADVMPLRGANRVLVSEGLKSLARTDNPGLRALREVCGSGPRPTPEHVAFQLAPRLNAAGRLGQGALAHELLTTESASRATELAALLDTENRRRREIEREITDKVVACIESDDDLRSSAVLVLGARGWHQGVIGIVASRLVELYHRPVMLACFDEQGLGRGSCRTVPGFALHEALSACSEHLLAHGGHAAAAGFEVREESFTQFAASVNRYGIETLSEVGHGRDLQIDAEISLADLGGRVFEELERLQPFGEGNPTPVFCARGLEVAGAPRRVGRSGDHLQFMARQDGSVLRAIAFGRGDLADRLPRIRFDAAFVASINEWKGRRELQLRIEDMHLPE